MIRIQSFIFRITLLFILPISIFYISVGFNILNPTDISWITGGDDPAVHYFGWAFFRQTPLFWPFNFNQNYGLDIASTIVYTDSIPILAIPLKMLNEFLPHTFQYQGVWYLTCFILQAFLAYKIFNIYTKSSAILFLTTTFLLLMPPLMSTVGMDAALASHFLILAAIYLHLNFKKNNSVYWIVLIVITAGIHFYLLAMILALWISNLSDLCFSKNIISLKDCLIQMAVTLVCLLIFAWFFGYFVESTDIGSYGYGLFRATVFSLFDGGKWSRFMPAFNTSSESYGIHKLSDGIEIFQGQAYIGLGMIFLIIYSIGLTFNKISCFAENLKNNKYFYCTLLLLFIFALSNNITIGKYNFSIPLPEAILNIASVLRSSIRIIWPVCYFISVISLVQLVRLCSRNKAIFVIGLTLIIQFFDISVGWAEIQRRIAIKEAYDLKIVFKNPVWNFFPKKYSNIIQVPLDKTYAQRYWVPFGNYGATNSLGTNSVYLARTNLRKIESANEKYLNQIFIGKYDSNSIYIVADKYVVPILKHLQKEDAFVRVDGFNIILPNWNNCIECMSVGALKNISLSDIFQSSKTLPIFFGKGLSGSVYLSNLGSLDLTGSGWSYPEVWGVWAGGQEASMLIPIVERNSFKFITLQVRPFVTPGHPVQKLLVSINDGVEQEIILKNEKDTHINLPLPKNSAIDYLNINVRMMNSESPHTLGIGDDSRKLGFGLISVDYK